MFKYALFKKKHLQPSVISVYLNDKEFTLKFSSNFLSIYQYFFSACEGIENIWIFPIYSLLNVKDFLW